MVYDFYSLSTLLLIHSFREMAPLSIDSTCLNFLYEVKFSLTSRQLRNTIIQLILGDF